MKKVAVLMMVAMAASGAWANDKAVADPELVKELKEYCQEVADEDGVAGKEKEAFLLRCVNEELEAEGYQPVKKL